MKTDLQTLLATGQSIIADGAMGSMLFAMGLDRGASAELWNVEQPDKVASVHRAYIEAGAQIILTNTLGGTRIRLEMDGLGDRTAELNRAGAQVASAEAEAASHPVAVAGDIGPTGQMLEPLGPLPFESAVAAYEEQVRALVEGGVTLLWIETMSDLEEVRAAVEGCRRAAPEMPIITTMTFDTKGRTMMGVKPELALETLSTFEVTALGANCGNGPDELEAAIAKMVGKGPTVPLVAKANAGIPRLQGGQTVYGASPDDMAAYALRVRDLGAQIIGACCGSTPAHIRAITDALRS
jgi:5-methyltetrahydrofolate--homocysteine methyltransferase